MLDGCTSLEYLSLGSTARERCSKTRAAWKRWARFVCASDAADAFVAYLKFLEGRGQAPPGAVVKAATDLMGVMERSKQEEEGRAEPRKCTTVS